MNHELRGEINVGDGEIKILDAKSRHFQKVSEAAHLPVCPELRMLGCQKYLIEEKTFVEKRNYRNDENGNERPDKMPS